MNRSESLAERYLTSLQLGRVVYEPDGKTPPDFVIGGHIAAEVRRLNQNFESTSSGAEGLEVLSIPLRKNIRRLLSSFGPSHAGECWYVGYGFKRPLDPWRTIRPLLITALQNFMNSNRQQGKLKITKNLNIDFHRSDFDHGSLFVLGANMDEDAGGWVLSELSRNLRLCITEKEKKIEPFRHRYPKWWLVLDDHIDNAIDAEERQRFKSEVLDTISHSFDRIVLLDPRGINTPFETEF